MHRLIANTDMNNLLDKINNQFQNIQDDYKILLNQLNTLYKNYEDIYTQINQVVKLPTLNDIENLVNMTNDFKEISQHFQNEMYAEEYTDKINNNLQ